MNISVPHIPQSRLARQLIYLGLAVLMLVLLYKVIYPMLFDAYVGETNAKLEFSTSKELTETQFEALARELTADARRAKAESIVTEQDPFPREVKVEMLMSTDSFMRDTDYAHIGYFRDAGIRRYDGPETCLQCHRTIDVRHADGSMSTVDTLDDLVNSIHFKFQSDASGFSTVGYDGRRVNAPGERHIPVGKIDRACGIPGSFSWTGWASLVKARPEDADGETVMRSEGCGQCHIGGNYYPATEKMMPIGDVTVEAKHGIDCLICHSAQYDMNQRYVIKDEHGTRWNQDRSMRAALTISRPTTENCLRCHQHNMGGDVYRHNLAAQAPGYQNQRILHHGAKRGNPFSPYSDLHAAAGMNCIDCHVPEGHKIPRGRLGVDLVGNDLPDKEVDCRTCHSSAPHNRSEHKALLNGHIARIACETCHIQALEDFNIVLKDWVHPTWNPEEGIWEPTDVYLSGKPGQGMTYLWFNGNGTFLANALGANPTGKGTYDPLMVQMARLTNPEVVAAVRAKAEELAKQYPDIDVDDYVKAATEPVTQLSPEMLKRRREMIDNNLAPAMAEGDSRIYPFKLFNALMYEDMGNQGPFGAMILPFDYATYYETGDAKGAVAKAVEHPIVQRMYQTPFKLYMMDEFMAYFGVSGGWQTNYPLQDGKLVNVEPRWMRQMGTLMVNHGIQRVGRGCYDCHSDDSILDYELLGYAPERAAQLRDLDLLQGVPDLPETPVAAASLPDD